MANSTFKLKFDKPKVKKLGTDWGTRFLFKAGAFIRTAAQQMQRKRKRTSKPGDPPSAHTKRYKRTIAFDVDKKNLTVVIGPLSAQVGETLEFGGYVHHKERKQRVFIRARPHMRPALEKGVRNLREKARDPLPKFWI